MPAPHPMAFKGGTSLSKVYGIIDRFSEDVDVTLDYRAFEDGFDPFAEGASRTATGRFSDRLRGCVALYVRDVVAPALDAAAGRQAPDGRYDTHVGKDGETVRFACPSAVEERGGYVASEVLLEFGGRNVIDPNERHAIRPGIAALLPALDWPATTVTVFLRLAPSGKRRRSSTLHATAGSSRTGLTGFPATGSISPALPPIPSAAPHWLTANSSPTSSGTRRSFCMPATPTTIAASTAGCASSRRRPAPRPSIGLRRHARRPHRRRRRAGIRWAD